MDWIGDVSNFVMNATAHVIATVTTKILSHPDLQDAFAETIALVVQKLLIQGSSSPEKEDDEDQDHFLKRFQKQQKQALRLLGKGLLRMGESSDNLSRGIEGDSYRKDIAESHTESIEEEEEEDDEEVEKTTTTEDLGTRTAPKQERQETPSSVVADDLGKVDSPSFGTVETRDTADEDYYQYQEDHISTLFKTGNTCGNFERTQLK